MWLYVLGFDVCCPMTWASYWALCVHLFASEEAKVRGTMYWVLLFLSYDLGSRIGHFVSTGPRLLVRRLTPCHNVAPSLYLCP